MSLLSCGIDAIEHPLGRSHSGDNERSRIVHRQRPRVL